MGVLNKDDMQFNISYTHKIAKYVEDRHDEFKSEITEYTDLFRDHATKEDFDKSSILEQIVDEKIVMIYLTNPD